MSDAFKKWLASPAGQTCMDLPLPRDKPAEYPENRLWWAFNAGVISVTDPPSAVKASSSLVCTKHGGYVFPCPVCTAQSENDDAR